MIIGAPKRIPPGVHITAAGQSINHVNYKLVLEMMYVRDPTFKHN
jgi:hypothetical protein